jgi:hypothetical protein
MSVTLTVPQSARTMFQEGFERVAQQLQSRFRAYADVKTGVLGKSHAFKKIQKREMTDVTGRLQDTNPEEQTFEYRYIMPRKAQLATILDEDDASELGLGVAPTGDITMEHESAAARKLDDYFIAGILGSNLEGAEDNIQSIALPDTQIIPVNYRRDGSTTNTGLTLAKLIRGKGRFGKLEVYGQGIDKAGAKVCMAVSQDELDNLLFDVEQTGSADYNKVKALVEGEVDYFMGIHFLRTERLPFASAGTLVKTMAGTVAVGSGKIARSCPMWVNTGVRLAFWNEVRTNIDILPGKSQAIQIFSRMRVNSCRKDEINVVNVLCEQDA